MSRRRLLIGGGAIAAAAAAVAFALDIRLLFEADYRTGVGEQLGITLPDGSTATLNTDPALALDYRRELRLVHVLRGEVLFEVKEAAIAFRAAALDGVTDMAAGSFAVRSWDEEGERAADAGARHGVRPDRARGAGLRGFGRRTHAEPGDALPAGWHAGPRCRFRTPTPSWPGVPDG